MATKNVPVETTEEKYDRASRLEKSVRSLQRDKERGEIYQKAADLFASLGDYQDSQARAQRCSKKANEYKEKYKQQEKARKQAEKQQKVEENPKKQIRKREIRLVIMGILIIALGCTAIFMKMKPGRYFRADMFGKIGFYEKSYKMFYNLKDYKDSEERYKDSCYKFGMDQLEDKDYEAAKKAFRKLEDYKDSEEKLTEAELELIKKCKIGEDALFGEYRWMVMEQEGDKIFLVKLVPINGVAYDKKKASSWEDSSMRKYLNGKFMDETFNKAAQKHILLTKVEVPLASGDSITTEDQLFFLTAEQAEQYQKPLSNYLRDWWLLDQGEGKHTAQFVSRGVAKEQGSKLVSQGVVMKYGYEMSDKNIFMRPAMWISLK